MRASLSMSEIAVYWIWGNVSTYRSLLFDLPELPRELLFFSASSKQESWPSPPPPVCIDDEEYINSKDVVTNPDIWDLSGGSTLATTPQIIERLEPFISMSAEVLALENRTGEELDLFALNVVNQLDTDQCMDLSVGEEERRRLVEEAASDVATSDADARELRRGLAQGDPWPVLYPAFRPDCLGEPTFFTVSRLGNIFCLERSDRDDSLLRRLAKFQVTGLGCTKVWSSVTGAEPINLFRP
jgi:hypothetical protein